MNTKNYLTPTKKYKTLVSYSHSVYRLVNSTYDLKALVPRMSKLFCQIFHGRSCIITLIDISQRYSLLKCQTSHKGIQTNGQKTRITDPLERQVIKTVSSVRKPYLLALPLVADDVIGFIIITRYKQQPPFDKFDHEMLVSLSEQAIMGIRNLQLYEEQQRIIVGSIKSLVTLLDMRVPQEYTHSPYFSRLVVSLAQAVHLDEKQIECLKYASLLHDAGKVDIPPAILMKTTKLTAQEFKIIKRHPLKGAQILRPLQIMKPVMQIITHHHEKYNGTGYPSRLKKGQIPLGARIMAVADAFEAMVYGRPYRERKDIPSAIREIKSKSGSQFDPKVVEAFMRISRKLAARYLKFNK